MPDHGIGLPSKGAFEVVKCLCRALTLVASSTIKISRLKFRAGDAHPCYLPVLHRELLETKEVGVRLLEERESCRAALT